MPSEEESLPAGKTVNLHGARSAIEKWCEDNGDISDSKMLVAAWMAFRTLSADEREYWFKAFKRAADGGGFTQEVPPPEVGTRRPVDSTTAKTLRPKSGRAAS